MRKLFTLKSLVSWFLIITIFSFPAKVLCQVAAWNTFGQTAYGTQGLSPSIKDANITVVGLTRGSGVTTSGTAAGNVWGGTGWSSTNAAT